MEIKLSDSELLVMKMLWAENNQHASDLAEKAKALTGWEKNTTYTLIQRLIKKKAIKRHDNGFICEALIDEQQVKKEETRNFLNKLYDGSFHMLVKSFLADESVSEEELEDLRQLLNEKKGD